MLKAHMNTTWRNDRSIGEYAIMRGISGQPARGIPPFYGTLEEQWMNKIINERVSIICTAFIVSKSGNTFSASNTSAYEHMSSIPAGGAPVANPAQVKCCVKELWIDGGEERTLSPAIYAATKLLQIPHRHLPLCTFNSTHPEETQGVIWKCRVCRQQTYMYMRKRRKVGGYEKEVERFNKSMNT